MLNYIGVDHENDKAPEDGRDPMDHYFPDEDQSILINTVLNAPC